MSRSSAAVALFLALVLGAAPIAADWCVTSCGATEAARTTSSDPICGREAPGGRAWTPAPHTCDHEHADTPSVVADRVPAVHAVALSHVPGFVVPSVDAPVIERRASTFDAALRPPPGSVPLALASALRV